MFQYKYKLFEKKSWIFLLFSIYYFLGLIKPISILFTYTHKNIDVNVVRGGGGSNNSFGVSLNPF